MDTGLGKKCACRGTNVGVLLLMANEFPIALEAAFSYQWWLAPMSSAMKPATRCSNATISRDYAHFVAAIAA